MGKLGQRTKAGAEQPSAECPGLDDQHFDSERGKLCGQALRETFERVLGGAVGTEAGRGREPAHAGDLHDGAGATLSQVW